MNQTPDEGVQISLGDSRFEITVDSRLAGFAEFVARGQQRVFTHTEIAEDFAGRGLAGRLVADALTRTRGAGQRIVAVCPFVAGYLEKHVDFADLVDPVTPELLDWLRSRRAANG